MNPTLLSRLVSRLSTSGKRKCFRNFLKGMRQADATIAPFHDRHAFRPRLEVLEDRLAPTAIPGAFSFAPQATFSVGSSPHGVAVGDFNGDGKPDIVVANNGAASLSVLLNTTPNGATAASYAAQQTFSTDPDVTAVAVADFNGDGKPDIAYTTGNGIVVVLLNTTPAGSTAVSFATPQIFSTGEESDQLAIGDINGDGRPDIVVANSDSTFFSVLINTTSLGATTVSFAAQQTIATPNDDFNFYNVALGDVNGDGRPDIIATYASISSPSVGVLLNTTPKGATTVSFAAAQTFAVNEGAVGIALADLNGTGRPDIATTSIQTGAVSILMNTTPAGATAASFAPQQTFSVGSEPYEGIVAGDFNGDGKQDLAVANYSGTISVLENTTPVGSTVASFAAQQTFANGNSPQYLAAADLNGDGRTDLVSTDVSGNSVSVYLNNLAPTATSITFPVQVGDFTGYGVNMFNRTTGSWTQLTPSDPTVLAANDNGYVVGSFGAYGVNLYTPGAGWAVITPSAASTLAIDGLGDIVGNFPGYGVFYYRPATGVWTSLTPVSANQLALDAYGNVYGTFTGYGIQEYSLAASTWSVLNAQTPTTFAVNSSDQIVANFTGYGVYKYIPYTNWQLLTTSTATSVAINSYGTVVATFSPYGVDELAPTASSWSQITPSNGSLLAIDDYGHAYGTFGPYGTFSYQPLATSWTQNTSTTAALLSIADYPFEFSSPF